MKPVDTSYKAQKWKVLIVLGIAQLLATILSVFLEQYQLAYSVISILSAVGWAVGILIWCKIDSEERGTEISSGFRIAIIILGIFALVYYLFRSRGFVGGLKGIGWILLYVLAFFTITTIIFTIVAVVSVLTGNSTI